MAGSKRFLAPQIAELMLSAGDEKLLDSHRRDVTVVFCDLRGFTAFAETAEPEEVMTVLREYHDAPRRHHPRLRGHARTLRRRRPDGAVQRSDALSRSVRARRARWRCEMRDRVAELAGKWHKLGHELGFGVGIAHGYATLGRIGFEGRFDYTAIGRW